MIGSSAGSLGPLKEIVAALPPDLAAAVFVIVHVPAWHRSDLPRILGHVSRLPVKHPGDSEPIRRGQIYVAPPDHHLLLDEGKVLLWRGPKENRYRPAINASFRTAATHFRDRVIGVILSGMLDDGATGLWWIKRSGGVALVQDPTESQFPEMPSAALEHVAVDHVGPASTLASLIVQLTLEVEAAKETTSREARP
jgi:two-component system chemotaxis response regulator CheB